MNFKVHAWLAAHMIILRRNLSTVCIVSQTMTHDVMAIEPISLAYSIADVGGFWSKLQKKLKLKRSGLKPFDYKTWSIVQQWV